MKQGQLLATLDPTFAAADVKQLGSKSRALGRRSSAIDAQLNDRPLCLPDETDPEVRQIAAMQREYYDQQVAQYKAQLASFNAKISQTQATIQKYQIDASRYQQREQIAQQIEDMRAILAAQASGSQLNAAHVRRTSALEMMRTLEFDQNSLVEAQHTLASVNG